MLPVPAKGWEESWYCPRPLQPGHEEMSRWSLGGRYSPESVHPRNCLANEPHLLDPQREVPGWGPGVIQNSGGNLMPLLDNWCLLSLCIKRYTLYFCGDAWLLKHNKISTLSGLWKHPDVKFWFYGLTCPHIMLVWQLLAKTQQLISNILLTIHRQLQSQIFQIQLEFFCRGERFYKLYCFTKEFNDILTFGWMKLCIDLWYSSD